ncbi:MAG: hypothetical protein CMG24_03260 [Candidatus Marinimicrobia bacterium]|nr:hypothetical protein [Candidatus Neomarinimicrobiota bacterium]
MHILLLAIILITTSFSQEIKSITIPSGVQIEMSGEVEMEFIDVEGEGGAGNQDALIQKVQTKSPHTRIDKAILDFKVYYSDNITDPSNPVWDSGVISQLVDYTVDDSAESTGECEGLAVRNGYVLVANTEDPSVTLLRAAWAE